MNDGYAGPTPSPKRTYMDWRGQPYHKVEGYGVFDDAKAWCISNIHHGFLLAEQEHTKHNLVFWINDTEDAVLATLRWKDD